ncbi:MAG: lactate utilization protein C [Niabella sp.]
MHKPYLSHFHNNGKHITKGKPPCLKKIDDKIEMFTTRAKAVGCDFIVCSSIQEVIQYAIDHQIKAEACSLWQTALSNVMCSDLNALNEQTILITADAAAAETGTIFKAATSICPTNMLFLPKHLLVMVKENQIYDYYEQAYEATKKVQPNFINIHMITGPSRTADIEQILVLGAHGPIQLTIFLIKA